MPHRNRKVKANQSGVSVEAARKLVLELPGVTEGRSYGMASFLLAGKFFARFRDDGTVLVLQLGTITDRDVLMQMHPGAFFFTDHYRDYPAVLIRLAEVEREMLVQVLRVAWEEVSARRMASPRSGRTRKSSARH